jgi:hypothetical protein
VRERLDGLAELLARLGDLAPNLFGLRRPLLVCVDRS